MSDDRAGMRSIKCESDTLKQNTGDETDGPDLRNVLSLTALSVGS